MTLNYFIQEALIKTASSEGLLIHKSAAGFGLFDAYKERKEQKEYEKADRRAQKLHEREMKVLDRDLAKSRAQSSVDLNKGMSINALLDPHEISRRELALGEGKLALHNRALDEATNMYKGIGESLHGAAKHLAPFVLPGAAVLGAGMLIDPIAHLIHGDTNKK